MDVARGEELAYVVKHLLGKYDGVRVAHAHDFSAALAGKVGIGAAGRREMPRKVDFGNDRYLPRSRIVQDLLDVPLRIVERPDLFAELFTLPLAHELRIARHVQHPCLAVRQMPVEDIQLVPGHLLQNALYRRLAEEVPRLVKMDAAPPESGRVLDLHAREGTVRRPLTQLAQRHCRIEEPRIV